MLPDSHKGFRPDIEVDNKRLLLRELKIAQDNLLVEQQCSSIIPMKFQSVSPVSSPTLMLSAASVHSVKPEPASSSRQGQGLASYMLGL